MRAKNNKIKEIILCSNGVVLSNKSYARELFESGVNLFNINLPSHYKTLHTSLTKRSFYSNAIKGIENLSSFKESELLRITFVINSLNYKTMLDYLKFLKRFPNIFYVEFNMIKVLGCALNRKFLVPRLSMLAPYLLEALEYSKEVEQKIIVDGIPLCFMNGFEELNIDVFKSFKRGYKFQVEKIRTQKCEKCSLKHICAGIRKDYFDIYGDKELVASEKSPQNIISLIEIQYYCFDLI
jgi:MoaA/NifB/PqqE/SkfB family radical SAM enzyme